MIVSPPRATYRYSYVIQFAMLFPLALLAFIAYLAFTQNWARERGIWALVAGLVATTVACFLLFLYLNKSIISIHDEGLVETRLWRSPKQIEWKDVKETRYRQTALAQDLMIHFGLLGAVLSPFLGGKESSKKGTQELKVIARNKTKISLNTYYKNVREAIRTTLNRVNPGLLESARLELKQGKEVQFGNLVLTNSGVRYKGKQVLYSEVESTKLSGMNFRLKQSGKWLDLVSVPSQKVPNLFVAIDLIEEFRCGGMVSGQNMGSMAATV